MAIVLDINSHTIGKFIVNESLQIGVCFLDALKRVSLFAYVD